MSAINPIETPTPIPAFAPDDKPPCDDLAVSLARGGATDMDPDEFADADELLDADDEPDGVGVGIGSPNFLARVYRGRSLPSEQQSVEVPQHHSKDVARPEQGLTRMLSFLWASLCHLSVSRLAFNGCSENHLV
tara:strand:+ start:6440 stop:6841 length:402 start_codon:yes stop_codon:yes gene_type:complete